MNFILVILMSLTALSTEVLKERRLFGLLARERLLQFARLTMPVANEPFNCRVSRYLPAAHHAFTAGELELLVASMGLDIPQSRDGEGSAAAGARTARMGLRTMLQMPYRHGKSELAVRRFVPWLLGKFPEKSGIVVTHTDSLANEHGRDVRDVMQGSGYKLVFGHDRRTRLRENSQAMDRLQVEGGGAVQFSGRGGLGAGFGADWMIFDDFFKNSEEAESPTVRKQAWRTFVTDCESRLNDESAWILLIGTRRHADDPPGRILDPRNENYDEREAKRWRVIRLPALSEGADVDPLGRAKDVPLWPARFGFQFWDAKRTNMSELVREDFETQGQCNPKARQGSFFMREWWNGDPKKPGSDKDEYGRPLSYAPKDLPRNLKVYCASDHAITEDQRNDATVLGPFGVDERKHIWILPEVVAFRYESPAIVDAMIAVMRKHRPLRWWAEREHISKSLLPFVRLRQMDEGVFGHIEESSAARHPEVRAWSIRGMFAARRVHVPVFAPFWSEMESQLLEFPNGQHDDYVSMLSHAGMGVDQLVAAEGPGGESKPDPGTLAWVKQSGQRRADRERKEKGTGW